MSGSSPISASTASASPNVMLEASDIVKDLGQGAGKVRALKGVSLKLDTPAS